MTYLGIDYGSQHMGLALGDDEVNIASPFCILENIGVDAFFDQLKTIIKEEGIEAIVVGVPMIGSDHTTQRKEVEEYVANLSSRLSIPVHVYDESYSSQGAQKMLRDTGEKKDHAVAAMLILQGYFDTSR